MNESEVKDPHCEESKEEKIKKIQELIAKMSANTALLIETFDPEIQTEVQRSMPILYSLIGKLIEKSYQNLPRGKYSACIERDLKIITDNARKEYDFETNLRGDVVKLLYRGD